MGDTDDARAFRDLLAAARGGDPDALGELFDGARPYLLAVADRNLARVVRAKGSESDVVQDAFLEAHKLLERFTGDTPEQFRAWLRAVLLNKLSDFDRQYRRSQMRSVAREQPLDEGGAGGGPDTSPSGAAQRAEEAAAVAAAMARLPPDFDRVIRLRTWDGLPFADVGRLMGRSEDAARMLWGRAVERLRAELENPNGQ